MKYANRDPLKSLESLHRHLLPKRLALKQLSNEERQAVNESPLASFLSLKTEESTPHGLFKSAMLPIKDILMLLQDSVQGKFNDHLQEALNNAEIEVAIKPQNPADSDSRKALEIKIRVVATAIDNYANLLAMVLGNKSLTSEDEETLHQAHKTLSTATGYLRSIEIKYDLMQLRAFCNRWVNEHRFNCFGLFQAFSSWHSSQYNALLQWFEDLTTQPLSEYELVGGIYCIRTQLDLISNKTERHAFRDGLDTLLAKYHYPRHTDKGHYDYLRPFVSRGPLLKLSLPNLFHYPSQDIVMDLTL
ncbi:hypothetical protein Lrub_2593 [Legionella rubrilucens]|uniref:Uncharacterized protein n=1 Tax=Legionella rubrilucens TaxID=458 RepID=A0A0W0XMW4_9GAMM|nr:hypothetical protein [Legionella rubrilucens]KTD45796.1 hypothetical protein Lrub_2593 [Legionella rubrilucens]